MPTALSRTAFRNSTADALSATQGGISSPALVQLASYLSCVPNETALEAQYDVQVSAKCRQ
eukprot:6209366-Pleurochrysis_carterae.AAC.3